MSGFDKDMEKVFDVVPIETSKPKQEIVEAGPSDIEVLQENINGDLMDDYNKVRTNYEELIDKGKNAIDEIIDIAKNSQHPRAFEVAATLIKNVTEANEKLILLQKQMREMIKPDKGSSIGTNIDKAIFIGSTSELLKALKNKNEG